MWFPVAILMSMIRWSFMTQTSNPTSHWNRLVSPPPQLNWCRTWSSFATLRITMYIRRTRSPKLLWSWRASVKTELCSSLLIYQNWSCNCTDRVNMAEYLRRVTKFIMPWCIIKTLEWGTWKVQSCTLTQHGIKHKLLPLPAPLSSYDFTISSTFQCFTGETNGDYQRIFWMQ